MRMRERVGLVVAIATCEGVGLVGSIFTTPAVGSAWYMALVKPAVQPPFWVFAPVWTLLFALMGVGAWLVWRNSSGAAPEARHRALGLFALQLALNVLWSVLFFGLASPGLALADIIALWLAIIATILAFVNVSRVAAWLLAPYLLWVTFAAYLNYAIWMLN